MKPSDKQLIRTGAHLWMETMDWSFIHAARWLIRRHRRGLLNPLPLHAS